MSVSECEWGGRRVGAECESVPTSVCLCMRACVSVGSPRAVCAL